jgi:(2R)-sulfolactate sulfo-lyase subunit alpha
MATQYVVHDATDTVGVVVIEGLKGGAEYAGWLMEGDKDLNMMIHNDIPIGHKVALKDFEVGEDVIKYGIVIGKVVAPIKKGEHVHVHNLKTKRW